MLDLRKICENIGFLIYFQQIKAMVGGRNGAKKIFNMIFWLIRRLQVKIKMSMYFLGFLNQLRDANGTFLLIPQYPSVYLGV